MSDKEKIEAVLEIVEEAGPQRESASLLGKVLRPKGTRDFPPNTGVIIVANNTASDGKYDYEFGTTGRKTKHLPANRSDNFNPGADTFKLWNTGTVDLDVTP